MIREILHLAVFLGRILFLYSIHIEPIIDIAEDQFNKYFCVCIAYIQLFVLTYIQPLLVGGPDLQPFFVAVCKRSAGIHSKPKQNFTKPAGCPF